MGQRFNLGHVVGPQGKEGPQGKQGETGDTGLPGVAATIKAGAVYIVLDSKDAKVVNVGTEQAAIFDFYIPLPETTGDMMANVYDPQSKKQDIFKFVEDQIAELEKRLEKKLANVFIVQPESSEEEKP